jgi:hypothetical protein
MMGCVISAQMFVMTMGLLLRGSRGESQGEQIEEGIVLPLMIFHESVTGRQHHIGPNPACHIETSSVSQRLFSWARINGKPKKSRCISIIKDQIKSIHFHIGGDQIPTVKEEPVKSRIDTGVQKQATEGLKSIDKSSFPRQAQRVGLPTWPTPTADLAAASL